MKLDLFRILKQHYTLIKKGLLTLASNTIV